MTHGKGRLQDNYGISRIDDETNHTHAWRVSLRRYGQRHVRNFPDRRHGGRETALEQALLYRDEFLVEYPPISRREVCSVRRSNNRSGITGVCTYAKRHERRDGSIKENWYWEASWPNERGENVKESFSVNRYGDALARQMAVRARQNALQSIEGAFWSSQRGLVAASTDEAPAGSLAQGA